MVDLWVIIILMGINGVVAFIFALLGAWIRHKGSGQGIPFIGSKKSSDNVFTVPFPEDQTDYPEDSDEKNILKRTTEFLKTMGKNENKMS